MKIHFGFNFVTLCVPCCKEKKCAIEKNVPLKKEEQEIKKIDETGMKKILEKEKSPFIEKNCRQITKVEMLDPKKVARRNLKDRKDKNDYVERFGSSSF